MLFRSGEDILSSLKQLKPRDYALSVQHLFAMFGATVLVPLITGFNPSTALLSAGLGTLIFHLCTKGKVPVFLGSSFAFPLFSRGYCCAASLHNITES